MITRDRYLNQLIERIGTSKIKIVTGLRRSGKSYLLNTIFTNYLLSKGVDKSHIIFIELDDEKNENLIFVQFVQNNKYMNVVFKGGPKENIIVEYHSDVIQSKSDFEYNIDAPQSGPGQFWHINNND